FQLRASDRAVDIVDIRLVVLRMMDFHRPRIDVRLQGVVGIGQGRKRVSHGRCSCKIRMRKNRLVSAQNNASGVAAEVDRLRRRPMNKSSVAILKKCTPPTAARFTAPCCTLFAYVKMSGLTYS